MENFDGPFPTNMPMNLEMETGATWSSFRENDNEHATWRKGPLLRTPKQLLQLLQFINIQTPVQYAAHKENK